MHKNCAERWFRPKGATHVRCDVWRSSSAGTARFARRSLTARHGVRCVAPSKYTDIWMCYRRRWGVRGLQAGGVCAGPHHCPRCQGRSRASTRVCRRPDNPAARRRGEETHHPVHVPLRRCGTAPLLISETRATVLARGACCMLKARSSVCHLVQVRRLPQRYSSSLQVGYPPTVPFASVKKQYTLPVPLRRFSHKRPLSSHRRTRGHA